MRGRSKGKLTKAQREPSAYVVVIDKLLRSCLSWFSNESSIVNIVRSLAGWLEQAERSCPHREAFFNGASCQTSFGACIGGEFTDVSLASHAARVASFVHCRTRGCEATPLIFVIFLSFSIFLSSFLYYHISLVYLAVYTNFRSHRLTLLSRQLFDSPFQMAITCTKKRRLFWNALLRGIAKWQKLGLPMYICCILIRIISSLSIVSYGFR